MHFATPKPKLAPPRARTFEHADGDCGRACGNRGGSDARCAEIVRRSVAAIEENWKIARNYTFLQRTEERQLDSADQVKSKEVKTYDITLLEGSPYLRLVERDDHPLPPAEEKKEREKLEKSIAERMKETPAERQRRIGDYEKRRERQRETMREVADAFDFKVAGQDRVDGRNVWILEAAPRPGFRRTLERRQDSSACSREALD